MAPVFASPDIAALVAAFPPPLPAKDRPSLVKSYSGNDLLDSRKVLARFRDLLETNAGRVKRSDLPARLGVEKTDWVVECYDGDIHYSKDLQYLVPTQEVNELVERLRDQAQETFVDVAGFASNYDISRQSCDRLSASDQDLRRFTLPDGKQILGHRVFVDGVKNNISSTIAAANGDKADLTSANSSAPSPVLSILAEEVTKHHGGGGTVEIEGEQAIYVPAEYQSLQEKRLEDLRRSKVAAAVNDLMIDGYCDTTVEDSNLNGSSQGAHDGQSLAAEVVSQFRVKRGDIELISFDQHMDGVNAQLSVIATQFALDKAMKELETIIANLVLDNRKPEGSSASLEALETALCEETSYLGLTKRLLRSRTHRKSLEASLASTLKAAEDRDSQALEDACRDSLVAPLELYAKGLKSVPDQALSERSSQYICAHFRTEAVPQLVQALRNANLLHDKARARDFDKLTAACEQSKSVADLQSAVSKFYRKQKMTMPDAEQLDATQRRVLREKLKNMQKMSRGSDVLQNLIWILMAEKMEGLFLSAGKDTSKMIKVYQSVGDGERGSELEQWRDALKAGTQSSADVQQMKAMAADAVEKVRDTDGIDCDV